MTAEIVNLNKVRKARERAMREREAQQNRLKYGQTKFDRHLSDVQQRKSDTELDGAKRDAHSAHADDDIDPGNVS